MSDHRELELHFEQIVTEHQNALLAALKRMLPPSEAEEVLQEASLNVWSCLYSLDHEAIKPYWYRTARDIAISRLRHEKVHRDASPLLQLVFDEASYEDSSVLLESQQSQALIVEAINALPPICRNVFVFRKRVGVQPCQKGALIPARFALVELTKGLEYTPAPRGRDVLQLRHSLLRLWLRALRLRYLDFKLPRVIPPSSL
jgi:RNA polymerase sigma factor (sigma-70 family)